MLIRGGARRLAQAGLSLVEMMVGVAVGMIVVSGAISLFSTNLGNSRYQQAENRLNQDLRAAADLVARDLRRARYWDNAIQGTLAQGTSSITRANPYRVVSYAGSAASGVEYAFSRDATVAGATENDTLDNAERFGFRIADSALQMQTTGGEWQSVTDTRNVVMTNLTITEQAQTLPLGHLCPKTCTAALATCPRVEVLRYNMALTGRSVRFENLSRTYNVSVRLRNERLEGQCPA